MSVQNDPAWQTSLYQMTVEDIERTKKRQYEVAHYSALVSAALLGLAKVFADDGLAAFPFYHVIIVGAFANGAFSFVFQAMLVSSLQKFRHRLVESRKGDTKGKGPWEKFWRDSPIFLFLLALSPAAAVFPIWYAAARSGLTLQNILAWTAG